MGLSRFACIIPEDSCTRVVYPDGHLETLSRPCSVAEFLVGNPDYFICSTRPHAVTNRMAPDARLERGVTYHICGTWNAQPFVQKHKKRTDSRARLIVPRWTSSTYRRQRRVELRSPPHTGGSAQLRRRVFDIQLATTELESMRNAGTVHLAAAADVDPPAKYLLKLAFFRHCLQALGIHRNCDGVVAAEPGMFTRFSADGDSAVRIAVAGTEDEIQGPGTRSAARCELGLLVTKRQEFYLRRAGRRGGRRRRKPVVWRPVLQSISEAMPFEDSYIPLGPQQQENVEAAPKTPVEIRVPEVIVAAARKLSSEPQQQRKRRIHQKSLYMA